MGDAAAQVGRAAPLFSNLISKSVSGNSESTRDTWNGSHLSSERLPRTCFFA